MIYHRVVSVVLYAIQSNLVVYSSHRKYLRLPIWSSQSTPPPLSNQKSILYVCESLSVLYISSLVSYFRFHIEVISYGIYLSLLWLTSLGVIICRSIHVAADGIISFFFTAEIYSIVHMYHIFFIQLYGDGLLGCLHVSAIMNSTATNIFILVEDFPIFLPSVRVSRGEKEIIAYNF